MFNLADYIQKQIDWSKDTFGPGRRTDGLCKHIAKELKEIEAEPTDLLEWVDVIILALDGAWRAGYLPEDITKALQAKQDTNLARKWPDWRTAPAGQPIEHVR